MKIELAKEEVEFITRTLAEAPTKFGYGVIKLLEGKLIEAEQAAKQQQEETAPKE